MNHFILKLLSGENVYGVIKEKCSSSKMVIIENPMVWEEYEGPDGITGSALVKYLNGTQESSIPISSSSITSMATMSGTFSDFYDAAVEVSKITDESYDERISHMTRKMKSMITDYHARMIADATGEIIGYRTDIDTIH
jgi:hypothetical protein